jgi:hypothetical protein
MAGWAIACAATASVAFIVAVVASTMLVMALHPHAPANVATGFNVDQGRVLAFLPFALGMYLLLACLGLAGWIRSRRTGRITGVVVVIGMLLITLVVAG